MLLHPCYLLHDIQLLAVARAIVERARAIHVDLGTYAQCSLLEYGVLVERVAVRRNGRWVGWCEVGAGSCEGSV